MRGRVQETGVVAVVQQVLFVLKFRLHLLVHELGFSARHLHFDELRLL